MPQIIPLTSDPDRTFDVELGGNLLTLRTYYNPTVPGWYMDVEGVAKGLALVPFADVFEASPEIRRTIGQMRLIVSDGADVVAESLPQDTEDPLAGVRVWDQPNEPTDARDGDYWTGSIVVNILRWSNDLAQSSWATAVGAVVTGPNSVTLDAATNSRVDQTIAAAPAVAGDEWTYSVELRGSGTVRTQINTSTGVGGASPEAVKTLTSEWVRYDESVTFSAGATGFVRVHGAIRRSGDTATVVEIRSAQVNRGGPMPFAPSLGAGSAQRMTLIKSGDAWIVAPDQPAAPEPRATLGSSAQLWWFSPGEWVSDDDAPTLDPVPGSGGYVVA